MGWLLPLVVAVAVGCASEGHPEATSSAAPVSVVIRDGQFRPQSLTIALGTTVTWTNLDRVPHTVSRPLERGLQVAGPDSPVLAPGDTYSYTYNSVGIFDYGSRLHPGATGTVTVTVPRP
jgi:plastocyanin